MISSSTIKSLKKGQKVEGKVNEVLPGGDVIVSFAGELLRLSNQTGVQFKNNESITLEVRQVSPIQFQIVRELGVSEKAKLGRARFDRSV